MECPMKTALNYTVKHALNAAALTLAVIGATGGSSRAADTGPSPSEVTDPLATARARIAEKKWGAAIDELKRVNASGSADWNNLMGYSLRKGPTPDLAGAEKFYDAALRIDPKHRGALEYSGELSLMTGDLPKAETRLATLGAACAMKCEEYDDLKQAVARFKSAGNRYVADKK
jgi:Flp pilus assembly protein TadD